MNELSVSDDPRAIVAPLLPQEMECGSGVTCWRRLGAWQNAGIRDRLHRTLLDRLGEVDRIDWERARHPKD